MGQEPAETTDDFYRFQLELPAGGNKELTVSEGPAPCAEGGASMLAR